MALAYKLIILYAQMLWSSGRAGPEQVVCKGEEDLDWRPYGLWRIV